MSTSITRAPPPLVTPAWTFPWRIVAFFDSDDLWLPHHLSTCVAALDANPEVDWVYAAGRRVELETGRVLSENSFYDSDGSPKQFLRLRTRIVGPAEDPR